MAKKPTAKEGAADEAASDPAAAALPADLPAAIKLLQPHGFIDEATQQHRYWQQAQVVFEPADIALLIGRGVLYEPAEPPADPQPLY